MKNKMQSHEKEFSLVISLIQQAKEKAMSHVNTELINLYWKLGEYVSKKVASAEWGEGVVDNLARYIQEKEPEIKGFNRRAIFRMMQFYTVYKSHKKVSTLLTQISWSNHLLILSKTKSLEEREFYIYLTIKERYSARELSRQIDSSVFERQMLSKTKLSPVVRQMYKKLSNCFKDTYILDFLDLPKNYSEKDLQKGLLNC